MACNNPGMIPISFKADGSQLVACFLNRTPNLICMWFGEDQSANITKTHV